MRQLKSPPFHALFCGLALLLANQPAHSGEPQSQRVVQAFFASEQGSALSIRSIWGHSITVGLQPFCQHLGVPRIRRGHSIPLAAECPGTSLGTQHSLIRRLFCKNSENARKDFRSHTTNLLSKISACELSADGRRAGANWQIGEGGRACVDCRVMNFSNPMKWQSFM